jgi:hypothetical protein
VAAKFGENDIEKRVRKENARFPNRRHYPSGGSAWLITRFTVGKARRNARSISSTLS